MAFDSDCKVCRKEVRQGDRAIGCSRCDAWYHIFCVGISPILYRGLELESIYWICKDCRPVVDKFLNEKKLGGLGYSDIVKKGKGTEVDRKGKGTEVVNRNRNDVRNTGKDSWKTVVGSRPKQVKQVEPISVRNKFDCLPVEEALGGTEDVLVYGDSIVRGLGVDSVRKSKPRRFRTSCYPGQGVKRVSEALSSVEDKPLVVSVGGNDIGFLGSEELKRRFRVMLGKLRDRRSTSVIMGILPRRFENREWSSRAIGMNRWLEKECAGLGLQFVDSWADFIGRADRYCRDGTHLSSVGREVFIDLVNRKFRMVGTLSGKVSVGSQTGN